MRLTRQLSSARAPDEPGAQGRAWEVVRGAYAARDPVRSRRRLWWPVIAPALAIVAAGLTLSPAGASVRRFIDDALGVRTAAPQIFSLPSPGRVLVSGAGGTWIVSANGAKRRLGDWPTASWSPHGRFVVVAGRDEIAALDPVGQVRWALGRPQVSDARWFSPNGYRVAYRSGDALRVTAGNGLGDHALAAFVAPVAPAWRTGHPYELTYATTPRLLVTRDADTGRLLMHVRLPTPARAIAWSVDGSRLLVTGQRAVSVYGADGRRVAVVDAPGGTSVRQASISPDARRVAIRRRDGSGADDVVVATVAHPTARPRRVLSGAGLGQVVWSPDGRWLLVSWPAADQWVFAEVSGRARVVAASSIASQFDPGARRAPTIEGWCCTTGGPAQ